MTFIELPNFTRAILELIDDSQFAMFQRDLLLNPKAGKVIPHSGGLRKVRMRLPGRGKRGGARVIYMHLEDHQVIVLFYAYSKADSEDLTPSQKARLEVAAETIKREFKHEK